MFELAHESVLSLAERLLKYPKLRERFESLLGIVENSDGHHQTADEAESGVIREVRQLGQEVLRDWSGYQKERKESEYSQKEGFIRGGVQRW